MNQSRVISKLWDEFVGIIDKQWDNNKAIADGDGHSELNAIRDFTSGWSHRDLNRLLVLEKTHEKFHRGAAPGGIRFHVSAEQSAKLLIMQNAVDGSHLHDMPPATSFITYRDSAAMAILLGYLIRSEVTEEWRQAVKAIEYTKLHSEVR